MLALGLWTGGARASTFRPPARVLAQVDLSRHLVTVSPNEDAVPAMEKAIRALGPQEGTLHVLKGNYSLLADRSILIPSNATISLVQVTNLLIQGNRFDSNGEVAGLTHGAYLITTSSVLICNNEFINNCANGPHIFVSHKEYKPFHDVVIVHNTFKSNGRVERDGGGLIVSSVVDAVCNIDIKQNKFIDNFIGMVVLSTRNYRIQDNTVQDSRSYGIYLGEELDPRRDASAIVSGNHVSGSKAEEIRLGLAPGVTGLVIENNDFQDNASGIGIRPRYQVPTFIHIRFNGFRGTKDGRTVASGLVSMDEKP